MFAILPEVVIKLELFSVILNEENRDLYKLWLCNNVVRINGFISRGFLKHNLKLLL